MTSELESKYSRLCGEYKKLRDKHKTLKEGILKEREKANEIQETLRQREIIIRKFNQERESLVFRNDHLTKQVGYLRDELDAERATAKKAAGLSSKRHKAKGGGGSTTGAGEGREVEDTDAVMDVLAEELQLKIEECSKLHSKLAEMSESQESVCCQLRHELAAKEEDFRECLEGRQTSELALQTELQAAREERAAADVRLAVQERDMKQLAVKCRDLHNEFENYKQEMRHKMSSPSVSTSHSPSLNKRITKIAVSVDEEVCAILDSEKSGESVDNFLNQLSSSANRVLIGVTDSLLKFRKRLTLLLQGSQLPYHQTASHLLNCLKSGEDIVESMTSSIESLSSKTNGVLNLALLATIASQCHQFEEFLGDTFHPLLQTHCQAENKRYPNSSTFQHRQQDLADSLQGGITRLHKFNEIVFNKAECKTPAEYAGNLVKAFDTINCSVRDLTRFLNNKISLEQEFLKSNPDEKAANNALAHSLVNLRSASDKMSGFLSNNARFLMFLYSDGYKGPSEKDSLLPSDRLSVRSPGSTDDFDNNGGVGGRTSTDDGEDAGQGGLLSCSVSRLSSPSGLGVVDDALVERRINALIDRVTSLERENHEISVKAQITEKRRHNAKLRCNKLEDILKQRGISAMIEDSPTGLQPAVEDTGSVEAETEREVMVKQYFIDRLRESTEQLHRTLGKTLAYYDEAKSLHCRLAAEEAERDRISEKLNLSNESILGLQDDLNLTRDNYAKQISEITNHNIELTEEIESQRKLVDHYKSQANSKRGFLGLKKS